jgi:DNA polymerase V
MLLRAVKAKITNDEDLLRLIFNLSLLGDCAAAGFPSPADDHIAQKLDLNSHLIKNPDATYFVRVYGDSMTGAGIRSGDILIVDRSLEPVDNRVVVACIGGELIVKRIRTVDGEIHLVSENEKYESIRVTPEMDFEIWGVVLHVIHSL